jgi:integrase
MGRAKGKISDGKDEETWPRKISFGGAVVVVSMRGDGRFWLRWREEGAWKDTTRKAEGDALQFAEEKVRELARATGRRWVSPAEGEALEALRRMTRDSGVESVGDLVRVFGVALRALGGVERLKEAAEYFRSHGPGGVEEVGFHAAVDAVVGEYSKAPTATRSTMRTAGEGLKGTVGDRNLLLVKREDLEPYVFAAGLSKRTVRNRLTQTTTFFARFAALGWWPLARPLPTVGMKRPRLDDVAPGIFSPAQMRRFLKKVMDSEEKRYLPYLLIAGWLGCRPSECLRLRRDAFDFANGMLYLSPQVVGKTNRERWVPIPDLLRPVLEDAVNGATAAGEAVCLKASRERLSLLARSMGMEWPADVLRHSAITYMLQREGNDYNRVAEWAGNSPKVIRDCYRRPIPAGWGDEWLGLVSVS